MKEPVHLLTLAGVQQSDIKHFVDSNILEKLKMLMTLKKWQTRQTVKLTTQYNVASCLAGF